MNLLLFVLPVGAATTNQAARTLVHALDSIARDYGRAVAGGEVIQKQTFAEMLKFSRTAALLNSQLSGEINNDEMRAQLRRLEHLIQSKADTAVVVPLARETKDRIIQTTKLEIAPARWPSLTRGRELYQQQCAECHGVGGYGDGHCAPSLDPKPTNFHDHERMNGLTPFHAFNTIRLGVPESRMAAYDQLSEADVWALSFYILSLRYQDGSGTVGLTKTRIPLATVASQSDEQIKATLTGTELERRRELAPARLHSQESDGNEQPGSD